MQRPPDLPGLTDLVQIGQGGNGVVYRAQQSQLRRVVAVKLLAAQLDESSAARFAREGHALGIVSGHPNIVPVYTADTTAAGTPYLVMLLCENGSLSERIQRDGALNVPHALDLGVRMCGALQTAHDAGLLHRDIKPGNILFDSYDVPRLADFGQAQIADANLTKTGDVVATPGYAAPEVLTGERATVRSDVYSLATTLMAALLGHGPFSRDTDENVAATLLRVLQEPPPNLRERGVPDAVAAELERAMAKTPGHRPMSAAEFGRRLQAVQSQLGLAQTPMIVAGAAAQSPLPPIGGTGEYGVTAPIADQQQAGATAAFGSAPTAVQAMPPQTSGDKAPRRSGKQWIAIAAVIAVLAGVGIWGGLALTGSRDPKNPTDASELLIGSGDYGSGNWQVADDMQLLSDVLGSFPESKDEADSASPSSLIKCLGLDPAAEVTSSKASAQYYDADKTKSKDEGNSVSSYRYARSLAFVTASAPQAERYVTGFASPRFDTCLKELVGLGVGVGAEQVMYEVPKISVPDYQPDVPDGVSFQVRQVDVPLEILGDGKKKSGSTASGKTQQAGSRYVSIIAMASGTSGEYVIVQSNTKDLSNEMLDAIADAFVKVATK